ncbi:MAG TPA: efflux RND transporter periplasmic adaptor subunit [Kofleriaceae bacterium]|nr:efflux RND transporter periplasmic adaptor subunit [Kofleriaceae bacterium]
MRRGVVVAMILLAAAACGDDRKVRPPAPIVTVSSDAGPAPVAAAPAWVGVITSAEAVDVAPRFDGVILTVEVRPGDAVAVDDVLATLDPRPAREEQTAAAAAAREAHARTRRARIEIDRARHKLQIEENGLATGTTAAVTVEDARLAVKAAEAAASEVAAAAREADTRVDRAAARLAETTLRAPFAGLVGARYHDPGASVGPSIPVVRVIGGGEKRLRFAVSPDEAASLRVGGHVTASLQGGGILDAVIQHVSPAIDQPSQQVFVEAALDAASKLTPGQAVEVRPKAGA